MSLLVKSQANAHLVPWGRPSLHWIRWLFRPTEEPPPPPPPPELQDSEDPLANF